MKNKATIEILMDIQSDWEDGVEYEAFNIAIDSVDKQIPRRTTSHMLGDYSTIHYCERCDSTVSKQEKYCKICGQKLDWSK